MKIVFDADYALEDLEADARRLHREYMAKNKLPRLAAATRALIPTYCEICSEKAWGPLGGGIAICDPCRKRGERKGLVGFEALREEI